MQREERLTVAVTAIEKRFGTGSISFVGAPAATATVAAIPTGFRALDEAIGIGGLPRGRVVEIFGTEGGVLRALALHLVAAAQAAGNVCAQIDAEHLLDVAAAKAVGVDLGRLIVVQPDCGEQALEIVRQLVECGAVDLILVDSVAALVPQAQIEGNLPADEGGHRARLMSQALRKITAVASKTGAMVVFLHEIGTAPPRSAFGCESPLGGNALKFYTGVRIEVLRCGDGRARANVVKNKVAPPFREAEIELALPPRGGR